MYNLSWILKNSKKLKMDFSQNKELCKWLMMTVKASTTDMCDLTPIQVQERAVMKHAFLRLPHRKCMGNLWLAVNVVQSIWTKRFWNNFSGSRSTVNEPNFKILCSCIHELLNVFEDSAQHVHTLYSNDPGSKCILL